MSDEHDELDEAGFTTDLIGQIEAKVTQKLKAAGIAGVAVSVNRNDYSLSFAGPEDAVARARKFLDDEREAKTRDTGALEE